MTVVCKYVPTRTRPRYFKPRDVGRIIDSVQAHGTGTMSEVLGVAIVATDNLDRFETLYRQIKIVSFAARALVAWTLVGRIRAVVTAVGNIIAEIIDRLGEFPQLRKSVSILEEFAAMSKGLVGILGGVVAVMKLVLGVDMEWLDSVRAEAYRYAGVSEPGMADIPDDVSTMIEGLSDG